MTDREQVATTLNRFMNCFDLKDWRLMAELLAPTIATDYADLRGSSPAQIAADDYVRARCEALQQLATQHLLTNLDIVVSDTSASASANCMIYRSDGSRHFNSHAFYVFGLRVADGAWRISSITQRILWNEGDPTLHKGAGGARS